MMCKLIYIYICAVVVCLPVEAFSQPKSSLNQKVSLEHPDSAVSCLAFIFKICRTGNDTKTMLEEYEQVKGTKVADKIKFVNDYLNSTKEFVAEIKHLDPVAFKGLKQYAVLTMKREPSDTPRFVVFCGCKKDLFLLYDPNGTLYSGVITTEVFLNQYQGTALVISPSTKEHTEKQKT